MIHKLSTKSLNLTLFVILSFIFRPLCCLSFDLLPLGIFKLFLNFRWFFFITTPFPLLSCMCCICSHLYCSAWQPRIMLNKVVWHCQLVLRVHWCRCLINSLFFNLMILKDLLIFIRANQEWTIQTKTNQTKKNN